MNLILWRHAEAEDGTDDLARALTPRGHVQAEAMARWLAPRLPERFLLLTSPARRAMQTAAAFKDLQPTVDARLSPDREVNDHLAALDWPEGPSRRDGGTVVLVGHQPTLGRLASLLLAGEEQDWSVKKGAAWWLSTRERDARHQVVLRLAIAPGQLSA